MGIKNKIHYCFAVSVFILAIVFFIYCAITAFPGRGIFDFPIFLDAAHRFIETGRLYDRGGSYESGIAIYKFPPLFGAFLVNGMQNGIEYDQFFNIAYVLHIVLYLAAIVLLVVPVHEKKATVINILLLLSVGLFFFPFLDTNILCLQIDIYVFFIISLAYFLFFNGKYFFSGFLLSIGVMLKIYPVIIMYFFLLSRRFSALFGGVIGVAVCIIYAVCILGFEESRVFFVDILPVLLGELPAGAGANNISLPTLVTNFLFSMALFLYSGTLDAQIITAQIQSGQLNPASFIEYSDSISVGVKAATALILVLVLALSEFVRNKSVGSKNYASILGLLYGAIVAFVVIFMQNSWTNYQIHLLIPLLILLSTFTRIPAAGLLWLRSITYLAAGGLWVFSFLDSAQERVNHFPVGSVSPFLAQLMGLIPGLTELTRWGRCLAALALLYVCISLAWKMAFVRSAYEIVD